MNRVQIVTVSTAPHNKYQKLQKQTARKWGYSYTSIGQNVEWKGFATKLRLVSEYFDAQSANPELDNTLFVVVDAYDLVFAGPPQELLQKYNRMNAPIVAGAERVCFGNCVPPTCKSSSNKTNVKYINGGCIMGSVQTLHNLYSWGVKHYPADDQIAFSRYRNLHCTEIQLDVTSHIVLNLDVFTWQKYDTLTVQNGRLTIVQSGVTPCIVHCPNIFQDLGHRWDIVLRGILPDYQPIETKSRHFHSLTKHVTKTVKQNKTFLVFTISLSYGILLFLIALGLGVFVGVKAGIIALHKFNT